MKKKKTSKKVSWKIAKYFQKKIKTKSVNMLPLTVIDIFKNLSEDQKQKLGEYRRNYIYKQITNLKKWFNGHSIRFYFLPIMPLSWHTW